MIAEVGYFIGVRVMVEPLYLLAGQAPVELLVGAVKIARAISYIVELMVSCRFGQWPIVLPLSTI